MLPSLARIPCHVDDKRPLTSSTRGSNGGGEGGSEIIARRCVVKKLDGVNVEVSSGSAGWMEAEIRPVNVGGVD